jgi:hypothetical protein
MEARFNVVRSLVPDIVTTARRLRDYLSPVDQRDQPMRVEAILAEPATTGAGWFRSGHGPAPGPRPR